MKVGLIDVDGHRFPNLAMMKISAWHKSKGHEVDWFYGFYEYDKVFMSKIFDFTQDYQYCIRADEIKKGGRGYRPEGMTIKEYSQIDKLPYEIEHQYPDYSIYGIENKAYGFLTRGCPRKCKFCDVSESQGEKSVKVADVREFWKDQKEIVLLDPNITAAKEKEELFDQLIQTRAYIDFTQGLDARLLTDKDCEQLNNMKIKRLHFAWDNYEFKTYEKLKEVRALLKYDRRKLTVYVLTNFNTTHEQDLERIYKLKELDYDPYIMIFDKSKAPRETRLIQRWVNNKLIFRSTERFEEYDPKRG